MPQTDLTQGHVPLSLARLTAPMMMGVSSSILVQVLEMGFIGQLSTAHVAAITFTFPLTMVLTSIALGNKHRHIISDRSQCGPTITQPQRQR